MINFPISRTPCRVRLPPWISTATGIWTGFTSATWTAGSGRSMSRRNSRTPVVLGCRGHLHRPGQLSDHHQAGHLEKPGRRGRPIRASFSGRAAMTGRPTCDLFVCRLDRPGARRGDRMVPRRCLTESGLRTKDVGDLARRRESLGRSQDRGLHRLFQHPHGKHRSRRSLPQPGRAWANSTPGLSSRSADHRSGARPSKGCQGALESLDLAIKTRSAVTLGETPDHYRRSQEKRGLYPGIRLHRPEARTADRRAPQGQILEGSLQSLQKVGASRRGQADRPAATLSFAQAEFSERPLFRRFSDEWPGFSAISSAPLNLTVPSGRLI